MIGSRAVSASRAVLGLGLLTQPNRLAAAVSFGDRLPRAWLVRVLGARMLLQSSLELARTTRSILRFGAAVDALHAASMLVLAVRRPGYRHAALASATVAAATAAVVTATSAATSTRAGSASSIEPTRHRR